MVRHSSPSLEINNLTGFEVSKNFLLKITKALFDEVGIECFDYGKVSISVALVSESEIEKINFRYRKKKTCTDVLSFSEYAKIEDMCNNVSGEFFLGEIILCPSYIEKSSKVQGTDFAYEMAYIFSHGILHLLGYSHGKKMFAIQEKIASDI